MKNYLLLVSLVLLFVISASPVFAQTPGTMMTAMQGATPTPMVSDYQLPYPGILPDSPLYKIKALRDRVISFLISDPLKKAEFDILQSDKRVAASLSLMQADPKHHTLAAETVSKAENYFDESLQQISIAKKQGEDTHDMVSKAAASNTKHLLVILQLEQIGGPVITQELAAEQKRVIQFESLVVPPTNK